MDRGSIIKQAQRYLERGQIDKAIAEWEGLAREGRDANVHNTLGDLYLKKGDKKSAIGHFHKSAEFFRGEGFSLKAIALYKKIINIDPSDVDALIALGELNNEKQFVTDALKYYLSAADVLSKSAEKDKLVRTYGSILSLAPFNIPLREKIAGLFLKDGLLLNATREYSYIARFYEDKGDYEKAKDYFRKIIEIQPDNKEALLGLSYICEKANDIGNAINYAKAAIKTYPDDTDLLLRCASLLKNTGSYDDAMNYLTKAIELKIKDVLANRLMGDICLAKGDKDRAWKSYKTAIDTLISENRIEEAITLAQNSIDADPLNMRKLLISLYRRKADMGSALKEMIIVADMFSDYGLYAEAIEYYRQALNISPHDPALLKKISSLPAEFAEPVAGEPEGREEVIEEMASQVTEGVRETDIAEKQIESDVLDVFEEFKKGLEGEIGAEDSGTHYNLGIAYKEMGLIDDAIKEFHVSKIDPRRYVQSMTMLGLCYAGKGLFSAAIEAFEGALESIETRDESYMEVRYNLASAHEENGNIREAFDIFKEIYDWNPEFRGVADKINKLQIGS